MTADIHVLDAAQIETLVNWAVDEGWNPGLRDAAAFRAADPRGFLGAFVDGRMVAGISVVAYDDHFGFLGLYICHPDFRSRGFGRAVWDAGMAYLGARTIGLDGVPEQQDAYGRMGFVPHYETMRMGGVLAKATARSCQITLQPDVDAVLEIDRQSFPAQRRAFLESWTRPPHVCVLATRDGAVCGYAVVRQCHDGQKVGPLFATDESAALDLLGAFDGAAQIDVPGHQTSWFRTLEKMGFRSQFRTARMYRGPAPDIRLDQIFGVTTLELG